jgi:hypothetical protein
MSLCMSLKAVLLTAVATLFAAMPAQAVNTLYGRDINGHAVDGADPSAVFLYDISLNITWLRDANANGLMTWSTANSWAKNLSKGGFDDWRLPTMEDTSSPGCDLSAGGGTDCGYNPQTIGNEMAHLWYGELGNKSVCAPPSGVGCIVQQAGWGLVNKGNFQNLVPDVYWYGVETAPDFISSWAFHFGTGYQFSPNSDGELFAMAVRPGDVLATTRVIPEPATLVLIGAALVGLGLMRRRRLAR